MTTPAPKPQPAPRMGVEAARAVIAARLANPKRAERLAQIVAHQTQRAALEHTVARFGRRMRATGKLNAKQTAALATARAALDALNVAIHDARKQAP